MYQKKSGNRNLDVRHFQFNCEAPQVMSTAEEKIRFSASESQNHKIYLIKEVNSLK